MKKPGWRTSRHLGGLSSFSGVKRHCETNERKATYTSAPPHCRMNTSGNRHSGQGVRPGMRPHNAQICLQSVARAPRVCTPSARKAAGYRRLLSTVFLLCTTTSHFATCFGRLFDCPAGGQSPFPDPWSARKHRGFSHFNCRLLYPRQFGIARASARPPVAAGNACRLHPVPETPAPTDLPSSGPRLRCRSPIAAA